jgi:transcriptional regulator with XRE-family HTH domain
MTKAEPTIDTKWFQNRVRDAEMSQARLAALLDIDKSALSLMLHGKREMKMTEATRLAEILALPLDQVLAHAGVEVRKGPASLPLAGIVDANNEIRPRKGGRVDSHDALPRECVAVRCEDRASTMDHWTFYYVPRASVTSEAIERLSVCQLASDAQRLAIPSRGFEAGTYNLRAVNGVVLENQRLVAASPVLWIRTG